MSPYMLVYGKEAWLPVLVELPALDFMCQLDMLEEEPMMARLAQLNELEEKRREALQKIKDRQAQMKKTFDKKAF